MDFMENPNLINFSFPTSAGYSKLCSNISVFDSDELSANLYSYNPNDTTKTNTVSSQYYIEARCFSIIVNGNIVDEWYFSDRAPIYIVFWLE